MKKFKFFSFASSIRGRKSSGVEDYSGYKNWRLADSDPTPNRMNRSNPYKKRLLPLSLRQQSFLILSTICTILFLI